MKVFSYGLSMFDFGLVLLLGLAALALQVGFIVALVKSSARARGIYAMTQLQASSSCSDPHMSYGRDTIRAIVTDELERRGID